LGVVLFSFLVLAGVAAEPPSASVERGLYTKPFAVTLTPAADGDTVYYALDGALPDVLYKDPLHVQGTTVLRTRAQGSDGTWSAIDTETYLFVRDTLDASVMEQAIVADPEDGPILEHTLETLPTLSLAVPTALTQTEQAGSLEWIDPLGETSQVECGIQIIGATSQIYAKNSFRTHFRSEYGASQWDFDLYGDDYTGVAPATSFDALTLRSGNHDSIFYLSDQGQYTRNFWMDETQLEMGHPVPHGRYAHLYVNGRYRGLYHVRERFDAGFLASYWGGDEEDYEAINGGSPFDGDGAAWNALVASRTDFASAAPWLNVENFLDYMVLNFYAANAWDWSYDHNWIAAGPTTPGEGGFVFHSADSDICLVYDVDTNILSNGGPSGVFGGLLYEGSPDFLVALADAIHRNLQDGGPLTADRARARYARIAGLAEEGIVAESARWGNGLWSHDGQWIPERDWLLDAWFPGRTAVLLGQMRAAGWYPLAAPLSSLDSGLVAKGTAVEVRVPYGVTADLWVSTRATLDPREVGGAVAPEGLGPDPVQSIVVEHGMVLRARLHQGALWGPVLERAFTVDEASPLVLNEWNAVDPDQLLSGGDSVLGEVAGNGGDWIELLVTEPVDLRGWSLVASDRRGPAGVITLADDPFWAAMPAGALFTIAEDLPEDAAFDPAKGDWSFDLRAVPEPTDGALATGSFDIGSKDWQLTILDSDGLVRFGPVGEGVNGLQGINSAEVGRLRTTPDETLRAWTAPYEDADSSTFGSPNTWSDGEQDLSAFRGETDAVADTGDTARVTDSAGPDATQDPPVDERPSAEGCACGHGAPAFSIGGLVVALLGAAIRRGRIRALRTA
jgi:hypothetical protein